MLTYLFAMRSRSRSALWATKMERLQIAEVPAESEIQARLLEKTLEWALESSQHSRPLRKTVESFAILPVEQ